MTHVQQELGAYVLGGLDADAQRRVREHLAACPACAAAHAEVAGLPALLDLAAGTGAPGDEPLPLAVEERVLDRFAREHAAQPPPRPSRRRWLALGLSSAVAGAAVAVAILLLGFSFTRAGGPPVAQYRVVFDRVGPAPADAGARAGLSSSAAGTVVRLRVRNLPAGDVYEVWCDARGWSASAGTFKVDARGNAYVVLTAGVRQGQYDRIRVVRRQTLAGGRVAPSTILRANLS
ncbi:MAG TPA: anti-sigma factor [Solirubrobacter sp.]|nr:anti-sigma factor [Solirubrobacter sp.]